MMRCFVASVRGCLSLHTEWRGAHIMVYTSQRLPITLIKFHTAQGDSLCPDQIANISWLKYMFAKRLEWKRINTGSDYTQTHGWNKGFRKWICNTQKNSQWPSCWTRQVHVFHCRTHMQIVSEWIQRAMKHFFSPPYHFSFMSPKIELYSCQC